MPHNILISNLSSFWW